MASIQSPAGTFAALMRLCQRINPTSPTSVDRDRIESVTRRGIDLVPEWSGRNVLILGAGDGYEVTYANSKGWVATGLTFLRDEIMLAQERREALVYGDIHALPFSDKTYDCCYSKETLEHSPCPILALLETNRILRPGGAFFHLIPSGWGKQRDWYHFSCLPDWVWCDLFRKAGFKVETVTCYPDAEGCTLGNVSYLGIKVEDVTFNDGIVDWRQRLGFANSGLGG